jgi:hypothetical protein
MYTLAVTLLSFTLLIQSAGSAAGRVVELVLPRDLNADDAVWLEVKLGVIERGAEIEIETTAGKLLGVISPHGIRAGNEAGTYVLPVPPEAISNKRLSVRLTITQARSKRTPTPKEIKDVRLKITTPSRS